MKISTCNQNVCVHFLLLWNNPNNFLVKKNCQNCLIHNISTKVGTVYQTQGSQNLLTYRYDENAKYLLFFLKIKETLLLISITSSRSCRFPKPRLNIQLMLEGKWNRNSVEMKNLWLEGKARHVISCYQACVCLIIQLTSAPDRSEGGKKLCLHKLGRAFALADHCFRPLIKPLRKWHTSLYWAMSWVATHLWRGEY